jgi:hypothetical protein
MEGNMIDLGAIGAAIGKKGAAKAFSTAAGGLLNRYQDHQTKRNLADPVPAEDMRRTVAQLTDRQAAAIAEFVKSAECEQLAFKLATLRMLKATGERVELEIGDVRAELQQLIRVSTGLQNQVTLSKVTTALFAVIDGAVVRQVAERLSDKDKIPAKVRANLIRSASDIAISTARNSELLGALNGLAKIYQNESQLRSACRAAHSKMRLPHAGTSKLVPYEKLYVQPGISLAESDSRRERGRFTGNVRELLTHCTRLLVLGDPGGGKSTLSLKLTSDLCANSTNSSSAPLPLYVILRDYVDYFVSDRVPLLDYLTKMCAMKYQLKIPGEAIEYWLLNGKAVVIFDGLDELLDTSVRRDVVSMVEAFAHRFPLTPILVTSRKVGYEEAALDPDLFCEASVAGFDEEQVEAYARKWFALDDSIQQADKDTLTDSFLIDSQTVTDLTRNPLMLSLMCGLYSSERYIPKNRPDVYERCALLLFEKWDKQRGIVAPLPFELHVQAAMRSLALWLYPRVEAQDGLPRQQLVTYVKDYLYGKRFDDEDEAESAANQFIDFCKGRAWVLTDVGAELYGFTHRTFLEYFAADQLVKQNNSARKLLAVLWPRIQRKEWDVVAQLAVQILGKSVEDGADDFIDLLVDKAAQSKRPSASYNALSFACRALNFIVPRPAVLQKLVVDLVDHQCTKPRHSFSYRNRGHSDDVVDLAGYIAEVAVENRALTKKYLHQALSKRLKKDALDDRATAIGWLLLDFWHGDEDSVEFWRDAAYDFRSEFSAEIETQARHIPWIAARLAMDGSWTYASLVERYGMRAVFDYLMAGYILSPPVAYVVLMNAFSTVGNYSVRSEAASEILQEAISHDAPWLREADGYAHLVTSGNYTYWKDRKSPDVLELSAATLLALPIFELEVLSRRSRRTSRTADGSRADFVAILLSGFDGSRKRVSAENVLDCSAKLLSPSAHERVAAWVEGRSNYVEPSDV